jgi:hypothetical protein
MFFEAVNEVGRMRETAPPRLAWRNADLRSGAFQGVLERISIPAGSETGAPGQGEDAPNEIALK